ncbi:MAG: hypothetical protein IJG45_07260 [Oscillospiraceae bacterium]|nr:hypothetical protein [Oscillospiraceae bacterium]
MISMAEYRAIVSELMDELPAEFYRELTGGVIVSEAATVPDYAKGNDLFVMGQYQVYSGVRQIVMFKGSFDRVYPQADAAQAKEILRGVLRHEFRHHLEGLGGMHGADSLEAEDARQKAAYLSRYEAPKGDRA